MDDIGLSCLVEEAEPVSAGGPGGVAAPAAGPEETGLSSPHICPPGWKQSREDWLIWASHQPTYAVKPMKEYPVDRVAYAVGGNLVQFLSGRRKLTPKGGSRGQVLEFSGASRLRLLRFLNSVDRSTLLAERLWFVTLTYPGEWSKEPRQWKRDLQTWYKRLRRAWGVMPGIWKMEFQERGAPHFHLLLMVSPEMVEGIECYEKIKRGLRIVGKWRGGKLRTFREWCSRSWYEVVGSKDERHLRAGTNVEPICGWNQATSYASKYMGKEACVPGEDGKPMAVGRFWGIWEREAWPIKLEGFGVPDFAWINVRRQMRRYVERVSGRQCKPMRSFIQSQTFFVPSSVTKRLLDYYLPGFGVGTWRDMLKRADAATLTHSEPPSWMGDGWGWPAWEGGEA